MKINVPNTLKQLSDIFMQNGSPLYIVGGFVRNAILGFCETDYDICSSALPQQVIEMLNGTPFYAQVVNPKLGTLLIKNKMNEDEFEHTTFRKESYDIGGNHSPNSVEFVSDIKQDASRRDFTANCIYYDINNDSLIDFYNGVADVNAHVMRTVETPEYVFSRDGLRILRLVRMSCELDFSISSECFDIAKNMVAQLADISQERFNKEIIAILFSDYKYDSINNPHAPIMGLKILSELNAWGYIFPEISAKVGIENINEKLSKNWVNAMNKAPPVHRISAFVYDFLTALSLPLDNENINLMLGTSGLMLSQKEIERQVKLFNCFYVAQNELKTEDDKRKFIQKNSKIILRLVDFGKQFNLFSDLGLLYNLMIIDEVPMNVKQLKINGNDLMQNFPNLKKENFSKILNNLLEKCCLCPELNKKDTLLDLVEGEIKNG